MLRDPYDLQRFRDAQAHCYADVLEELRRGRKQSHWMWFIFPQLSGLGRSATAERYGMSGAAEAAAYLADPVLGERLRQCCNVLLDQPETDAARIFGALDALKLRSSMTLFDAVACEDGFDRVLAHFYGGKRDPATGTLLAASRGQPGG